MHIFYHIDNKWISDSKSGILCRTDIEAILAKILFPCKENTGILYPK